MTYIWNINCHKWRNIGLIGSWVLVTIGLASTIYYLMNTSSFIDNESCWQYDYDTMDGFVKHGYSCVHDKGAYLDAEYLLLLSVNGVNVFIMWYVINNKYKILDVKCTSNERPSTVTEITNTFTSNEEYFKTKESQ